MNNYNNFFSSSQFFSHDDLNWATTDPYNLFDETMLGSSIFYNPIYGYDNQLLLQSSFPFYEDDINKDANTASTGNYIKEKSIQKPGAPIGYVSNNNSNMEGSSASTIKYNPTNNLYCQQPSTSKKVITQSQIQLQPQQSQSQFQQHPQPQYMLSRANSNDTIFSCISQSSRYDSTEQLQRGGMVRADLSQYDLLYDSESSSSKHYIPTANPRNWSIFDQPRENFFNSIDYDYNLGDNCNSLSFGIDNCCSLNNTINNYNMPLTVDPSAIICNNNNIKLDTEEDDPIIRSILCSESEDEEVYEGNNEKQKQLQQIQKTSLIKSNKIVSDSEDDDDDDVDFDENLEDDTITSSLYTKNHNNIYNKNVSNLDLINTNIANKKNDLSIFTYEVNYSKNNENKDKLYKDDNIKNEIEIKKEIKEENATLSKTDENKNKVENIDGPKRGRKASKIKNETISQDENKDLSSNIGDLSNNPPYTQTKRKRRRGKNSEITDTIISTTSSSSSSMNEMSGNTISKRGRKANVNNYVDSIPKKTVEYNYNKKRMIHQNLQNNETKRKIGQQYVEINNTNYNTTAVVHPNEYKFITLDNQGLYINGKINDNLLQDSNILTVANPNNSLSHIATIDNNMVLPVNTNNLTPSIGNNNSIISIQHQANVQKPTSIVQTVNNTPLPQANSTTRSTSKSNINHTKKAMNGSNTNKPTKKHCSKACINCKRAHLACDASRPCKRCVSQGRTDCVSVEHKKRGRPKCSPDKKAANNLEKKKTNAKNTNVNVNNNSSNSNNNNNSNSDNSNSTTYTEISTNVTLTSFSSN
ncbi:hypothetical protein BCR36DRAFT_315160 [Piromyces finnis]|uniref:Zn(2)-C6 fungal-type domain-containing protein n=1 Tax=Piromyces finnis TaxID=1754191 RepID=A0A1Y1VQ62_9FUNG|nr:hypothetical protein BCR36DRAFT_315160 [Piromyces finnis]|eukprot:ORX61021.1 hypothetical protein BCR36DRAFT_315160 [Piromyces finnis]